MKIRCPSLHSPHTRRQTQVEQAQRQEPIPFFYKKIINFVKHDKPQQNKQKTYFNQSGVGVVRHWFQTLQFTNNGCIALRAFWCSLCCRDIDIIIIIIRDRERNIERDRHRSHGATQQQQQQQHQTQTEPRLTNDAPRCSSRAQTDATCCAISPCQLRVPGVCSRRLQRAKIDRLVFTTKTKQSFVDALLAHGKRCPTLQ